jgi:hypothetical protein
MPFDEHQFLLAVKVIKKSARGYIALKKVPLNPRSGDVYPYPSILEGILHGISGKKSLVLFINVMKVRSSVAIKEIRAGKNSYLRTGFRLQNDVALHIRPQAKHRPVDKYITRALGKTGFGDFPASPVVPILYLFSVGIGVEQIVAGSVVRLKNRGLFLGIEEKLHGQLPA